MITNEDQIGAASRAEGARARSGRRLHLFYLPGLGVAMGTAALAWFQPGVFDLAAGDDPSSLQELARNAVPADLAALNVDDEDQIVVEGEDAVARNAALPMASGPLGTVKPFRLADIAAPDGRTALKCLTQAIYYEAGFEPEEGRRAVAQVVLNRVRHPAYPGSVCGVVYEGSYRRTGCQFSFTCDGSLLRPPEPRAWRRAEQIAREALTGSVEKAVGTSTHYHADYVLPKWAFTLGKLQKIGRHIFYRFNGRAGGSAAFSARYAGNEHIPAIDFAMLRMRLSEDGAELADAYVPGLTVTPHVTDRHADNDVGGRIDMRKEWRLEIPDPVQASAGLREAVAETQGAAAHPSRVAVATTEKPAENP